MLTKKFLPRAGAAALALATIAAATPASAAVTASHYQQKVKLVCGSGCTATFPKLAANKALDIERVACDMNTSGGKLGLAEIALLPAVQNYFSYPLPVIWERDVLGQNAFMVGGEVDIRVPYGKQVAVFLLVGGSSPGGFCSITGTLYTQS